MAIDKTALAEEVMAYFKDPLVHLAPSQIDMVMGLRRGLAHDVICLCWYEQKVREIRGELLS